MTEIYKLHNNIWIKMTWRIKRLKIPIKSSKIPTEHKLAIDQEGPKVQDNGTEDFDQYQSVTANSNN